MAKKKTTRRTGRQNQLDLDFGSRKKPTPQKVQPKSRSAATSSRKSRARETSRATAESMAAAQREISVSEFFAKNRHLLGFDNKRKALLTAIKEAVDNCLDACEEAHILPEIHVRIKQLDEDRFRVTVRDNGPGIVKQQIPNIFGKLLYGSKFHRLKMSRGQQGIGISAAGMYGLLTTGKPIHVTSRVSRKKQAHHYQIQIDTKKNRPEIVKDDTVDVSWNHGTEVTIDMVASYVKGKQSVDEYLFQTSIANPHCTIHYKPPAGDSIEYTRSVEEVPEPPVEIKPHPHGVELGMLIKMVDDTTSKHLGGFLQGEFCRVSARVASSVAKSAGLTPRSYIKSLDGQDIERVYKQLQKVKLMAPPTNCLGPIGAEQILSGLLQGVKAEFYTASTRPPAVYRGNPFQIEVGLAYGGELGPDKGDLEPDSGKRADPPQARVIRYANRVPLLYQQSACCMFKSVIDMKWSNYGISQARGALPGAPLLIFVHMASVWVPFTSESKEAIADYDSIRTEIRRAIQDCGRRLGTLLRRKKKSQAFAKRRDVFTRYIDEVVNATHSIATINESRFRRDLLSLARQFTAAADLEFDEHGKKVVKQNDDALENTVIVERSDTNSVSQDRLFADQSSTQRRSSKKTSRAQTARKRKK